MKLVIGTVQFGLDYGVSNSDGKTDLEDARSIVKLASENGIYRLDTAHAYGTSEKILGKIGVSDYKVVTKVDPTAKGKGFKTISGQFAESCENLSVTSTYGVMLHSLRKTPHELIEDLRILESLKEEGKTEKIGVSVYSPDELNWVLKHFTPDIVQFPINIFDQRFQKGDLLRELKNKGVQTQARSVFLQGLLLLEKNSLPSYFNPWKKLIEKYHSWLEINRYSPYEACLRYVASIPFIDEVVVGVNNPEQLSELLSVYSTGAVREAKDLMCDDIKLVIPSEWRT